MDPEAYAKHNKPESGAKPGVYKHPKTGEELWATSHPFADGLVHQEWVYDRPLPAAEELRELTKSVQPAAPSVDEVKKLREQLKEAKVAQKAAEAEAEAAKAEAKQAQEDAEAILEASKEDKANADEAAKETK
jgi:hypothetical protein